MSDAPPRSEPSVPSWRPTLFSTTAAVVAAGAATLALAASVGTLLPALIGVVAGAALGATVIAVGTATRRLTVAVGGLLATGSGLALLAAVGSAVLTQVPWPPVPPVEVLAIAPFAFAFAGVATGFGAFAAMRDLSPLSDAGLTGIRLLGTGLVPAGAVAIEQVRLPVAPVVDAVDGLHRRLFVPGRPPAAIEAAFTPFVELMTLLFVAASVLAVAVGRVPLVPLASESARPTARAVQGRLRQLCGAGVAVAVLGGFAVGVAIGFPGLLARIPPGVRGAVPGVAVAPLPRRILGVGVTAGIATIVGFRLTRIVASTRTRLSSLPVVPLGVGGILTLAVAGTHESAAAMAVERASSDAGRALLDQVLEAFGSFTLLAGIVLLGLVTAIAVSLALSALHATRLLGSRSGAQIAGTGVFLAAVSAGIADGAVVVVLGGVAASLFVWDLGEFGATLGREIGCAGVSRRAEIVHGAGSAVYAALAVALGAGTLSVIGQLPSFSAPPTTVGVVAASVGTVLLFLASR